MEGNLTEKVLYQALRDTFSLVEFRGEQKAIIETVLRGESALVLMPTGMGKSLCYQLPAVLLPGLTVIISPLIALMQDQVDKAIGRGIKATYLASTLRKEEREQRLQEMAKNKYKIIYVTPERFRKSEFLEALRPLEISLLAVDEAHCISMWGHDFRPDYSRLGQFRELLRNPPTLALTATATSQVQKDILRSLGLLAARTFSAGVERKNLKLAVHSVVGDDEKIRGIVGLRHLVAGPTILYFSLISTLQKFSSELGKLNIRHTTYHGQLPGDIRRKNQKLFLEGTADLILATPAFGLGVDKPDVRLLIHVEMPASIEAYYQEYGRAGRDGLASECHLFLDTDDVSIQMDFLKWGNPEPSFIRRIYELVEENSLRLQGEGIDFLRDQMNFYNRRDYRAEASLNILERMECVEKDASKLGFRATQPPRPEQLEIRDYELRMKAQNSKLLQMLQLAQMEKGCRTQTVYQYFGFTSEACGNCDLCINNGPSDSRKDSGEK